MRPSKFLWQYLIALLLMVGLVMSGNNPDTREPVKEMAINKPEKKPINTEGILEYSWRREEIRKAVTHYFERAAATGKIVGAGVSIVKGDSIIYSEGIGKSKIDTDERVDAHTIFRLGSLSKGFTGILAAKLVEEGKMGWNDPVRTYIPSFQLGTHATTDQITFKNILSHTSGAPYHSFTNLVEAGLSLDQIAGRFKEVKPISAPGSLYSYQNALFALSGAMMQKVTGENMAITLKDTFFEPLGMCSTVMDHETMKKMQNVAFPHVKWRKGWRARKLNDHYYNALAAGGINASPLDMAKWMRFLLGHHPDVLDESVLKEAFQPVIEIKGRSKYYQRWPGHISSHYGYGWRIHKFREGMGQEIKTMWHHGGSVNNFRNEIALYPEDDLGICVLLNSQSRIASHVIPDLYEIIKEVLQSEPVEMAATSFSD